MSTLQEWGLSAYYFASLPLRRRLLTQRLTIGQAPACVLFYHRVADAHPNAWTISTTAFRQQMDWLCAHTDVVTLAELQQRVLTGNVSRITTHVTFDDGYAENCEYAIPLLLEKRIPCTYFVALDFVRNGHPFPHDQRAGRSFRPNSIQQLRSMAAVGIEIGSHSRTHADLGSVRQRDQLHDEVVAASHELSELMGCPVRYFAFPYGRHAHLNRQAIDLAYAAGLQGVCSAYGDYNWPGPDVFHIRRIHGDPEFARFRNWLTLDPRKLERPNR